MSNRNYPYISNIENRKKNTSALCVCGEVGTAKVTIQTSWFRGEDEVLWSCDRHKNAPNALLAYKIARSQEKNHERY